MSTSPTNRELSCERNLIIAYVDGELDEKRAQRLEGHLEDCAECREDRCYPKARHKFFGSRRLRASPQGYSPWTSLVSSRDDITHGVLCRAHPQEDAFPSQPVLLISRY